jgi:sarcosine oxidase
MRRFPAFRVPHDFVGVVQPDGGILQAEASVFAQLALAAAAGAEIRSGEAVRAVEPRAGCVPIVTDRGSIEAGAAIIAAGPWMEALLPALATALRVTREVMAWFEPTDAQLFLPGRMPVFMIESRHGLHYGIPADGSLQPGIKVAKHHHRDETVDPDAYDQAVRADDEALIRAALAEHIPAAMAASSLPRPASIRRRRTVISSSIACPALPTSSSLRPAPAMGSNSRP